MSKFKLQASRFTLVIAVFVLLCSISFLTRIVLLADSAANMDWSFRNLAGIFGLGLVFDAGVALFTVLPLSIYVWLMPDRWFRSKVNRFFLLLIFFLTVFLLLFNAISEWFFWREFAVRYNFIAVDYLVYTTEVIGNIRQSYPVNSILVVLAVISAGITGAFSGWLTSSTRPSVRFRQRLLPALSVLLLAGAGYLALDAKWKNFSSNQFVNELSGNGMYDFGHAFWHNELDYPTFYRTLDLHKAEAVLRSGLGMPAGEPADSAHLTLRNIRAAGPEKRMNVVLISVESLSADFLGSFGNEQGLTPNLDSLAASGVLFTNLYASGTRTVRGLEALTLSIPPTPGQSIVKRPGNSGLFSLGSVFRKKGYESRYIYGGYGYFDNMTAFFSGNGYTVTDRNAIDKKDIHYQNIWGVADEDLFTLSIRLLDGDFKKGKPFFAHIMTVSNHRPFTYPDGRIAIPSHTGREGAVKYTDYAIGKFMREAASRPWFANTLFVIVADHCASSAGKVELPVNKYHIPMVMYAPGLLKPQKFDELTAQVDVAPTILGLLDFSYPSKFFGRDVFHDHTSVQRAFISTYQSLGYLEGGKLVILDPNKKVSFYQPDFQTGSAVLTAPDTSLEARAIANYQIAAYLYSQGFYNR